MKRLIRQFWYQWDCMLNSHFLSNILGHLHFHTGQFLPSIFFNHRRFSYPFIAYGCWSNVHHEELYCSVVSLPFSRKTILRPCMKVPAGTVQKWLIVKMVYHGGNNYVLSAFYRQIGFCKQVIGSRAGTLIYHFRELPISLVMSRNSVSPSLYCKFNFPFCSSELMTP